MRWTPLAIGLGLGVATLVAAAKAHGRQLRLERELAGYWEVTFASAARNPAWVQDFWRREQLVFWGLAGLLALASIGYRLFAARVDGSLPLSGPLLHVLGPLIGAFVATGLVSLVRLAIADRSSADLPADWLGAAMWGSAGWWALTFGMVTGLFVFAWRK